MPIAHRRSKRGCGPLAHLIEECNLTYYALSCVEQVENTHELATYHEANGCGDCEKWILAMHEEICSLLRRIAHGRLFLCLRRRRRSSAANGS